MKKKHVEVWEKCLNIIEDNIPPQSYNTWFIPIKPISLENDVLTIQVPSQFFYEWLEEHYIGLLRKTIRMVIGQTATLEYSVIIDNNWDNKVPLAVKYPATDKKATQNNQVSMPLDLNKGKSRDIPNPFIIPGLKKLKIESQLVETYSFDNFIEGECNRLARSAGWAISENPGKQLLIPYWYIAA